MKSVALVTWAALALSVGIVIRSIQRARAYRRRGETMPIKHAGRVADGLATLFLLGGILTREHETLAWGLLAASLICLFIEETQSRAALRRS